MMDEHNSQTLEAVEHQQTPLLHNLPAQLTPIVDREQELEQIHARLHDPECRLLTLVGPGGVGKTRLALAAAQAIADDGVRVADWSEAPGRLAANHQSSITNHQFKDGVVFVPLERIDANASLQAILVEAAGFQLQGPADPQSQIIDYLRTRHLLIVLDNLEHLIDRADILLAVLHHAPGVKMLATSRERLNFDGEWVLDISGLPYPQQANAHAHEQYPAIQLFVRSAQAVQPGFTPAPSMPAIVQICQLLDGLPLGIQLAAASVRMFSCEQIATELQRSRDFLATTMRNVPARHRNLRAVFEHSWVLLSAQEQQAFQALAIFPGSFTANAAAEVAHVRLPTVTTLVDKSLLQSISSGAPMPLQRFKMHQALHSYAAERLADDPTQLAALQERHCAYYSRLLYAQSKELLGPQVTQALRVVGAELENVRTAWHTAALQARLEWLEQSLPGLVRYYLLRGPLPELQTSLETAIEHMRTALASAPAQTIRPRQRLQSMLLAELARCLNERGQYQLAATTAQDAITLAQSSQHLESEALGYQQLGRALHAQSRYAEAHQPLATALTLARSLKSAALEAGAHYLLGANRMYRAEYVAGVAHYEESARLYQALNDVPNELKVRYSLAVVHFFTGDYRKARAIYEQCLQGYRELDDKRSVGHLLNNIGAVYAQLGDYVQAKAYYDEALVLKRSVNDSPLESVILANLGQLANSMGHYHTAVTYCREAMEISQVLGEQVMTAYAQTCLGYALISLGWLAEAADVFGEAVALRQALGQADQALEPLAGLASVYLAMENPRQAQPYVEEILPHLKTILTSAIIEPLRIYLTCYRVLQANRDLRAINVLQMAHQVLQERAARLHDEALRRSYLERVPVNREILTEIQKTPEERKAEGAQHWQQRIDQHHNLAQDIEDLLRSDTNSQ